MAMAREIDNCIQIVAALVRDQAGRVLLVRKRGTQPFMQPGGKLQASECHLAALRRELNEELNCSMADESGVFLGTFTAPAANEAGYLVEATLFSVSLIGAVQPAAEIEEIIWLHPAPPFSVELAPLTRDHILPLAIRLSGCQTVGTPGGPEDGKA
jgi:8-oxo-dGTP diphosphatase